MTERLPPAERFLQANETSIFCLNISQDTVEALQLYDQFSDWLINKNVSHFDLITPEEAHKIQPVYPSEC